MYFYVSLLILGDPVYPALPWLMKPYEVNAHTTAEQQNFNNGQIITHLVVEMPLEDLEAGGGAFWNVWTSGRQSNNCGWSMCCTP